MRFSVREPKLAKPAYQPARPRNRPAGASGLIKNIEIEDAWFFGEAETANSPRGALNRGVCGVHATPRWLAWHRRSEHRGNYDPAESLGLLV